MSNINLAGDWSVYLDREDKGLELMGTDASFPPAEGVIKMPGCLEENRLGDPIGPDTDWVGSQVGSEFLGEDLYAPYRTAEDFKYIYWLQPDTRFVGPAWYKRTIEFPEGGEVLTWLLTLERTHWETRVWFDGAPLGSRDSLCTAHEYILTRKEGQKKGELVIRVDNRMIYDMGPNAHSVSDHTQGSWNGVVGEMSLAPVTSCRIEKWDIFPVSGRKSAIVKLTVTNREETKVKAELTLTSSAKRPDSPLKEKTGVTLLPGSGEIFREIEFDRDLGLWDEHNPQLVTLDLSLTRGGALLDSRTLTTGLRDVQTDGHKILVNGRAIHLRGTLECCVFPKTGHPPTDGESWKKIYAKLKDYGMNHMRFHSWCPPEAAFSEADKAGVYLQVECPLWKNQGVEFKGDADQDEWLFRESERIIGAYGHHPSFILFNSGNEPYGRDKDFLAAWTTYWKQKDSRRLYTCSSGWPENEENQFHVTPDPRLQRWGEELKSRINGRAPETVTDYYDFCRKRDVPVITHENGQWCVFPDFKEMKKYTGFLKPKNYEVFQDIMKRRGMADKSEAFLYASGKQQLLCYKEEIESNLRTENISGFQLLGLTDFPGQGTALVGVLNAFWEDKGYCEAQDFHRFCSEIVPLARLPRRIFRENETITADLDLYNYSDREYENAELTVSVKDSKGKALSTQKLGSGKSLTRGLNRLSPFSFSFEGLESPARYTLEVQFPETGAVNNWDVWVYPKEISTAEGDVYRCYTPAEALKALKEGKKVLLTAPPAAVDTDVATGFSSVFWNTSWTRHQAPHTLGLSCDSGHPVFAGFPTEDYSNWQWWEPMHDAASLVLDDLPGELEPLVQPIDTWFRSHKLAMLFECRCGGGQLMVSSMNFDNLEGKAVSSQLLASICAYMNSGDFQPAVEIGAGELESLFKS